MELNFVFTYYNNLIISQVYTAISKMIKKRYIMGCMFSLCMVYVDKIDTQN